MVFPHAVYIFLGKPWFSQPLCRAARPRLPRPEPVGTDGEQHMECPVAGLLVAVMGGPWQVPFGITKLVPITPISLVFMIDI